MDIYSSGGPKQWMLFEAVSETVALPVQFPNPNPHSP
jgi:hypothetical protein